MWRLPPFNYQHGIYVEGMTETTTHSVRTGRVWENIWTRNFPNTKQVWYTFIIWNVKETTDAVALNALSTTDLEGEKKITEVREERLVTAWAVQWRTYCHYMRRIAENITSLQYGCVWRGWGKPRGSAIRTSNLRIKNLPVSTRPYDVGCRLFINLLTFYFRPLAVSQIADRLL